MSDGFTPRPVRPGPKAARFEGRKKFLNAKISETKNVKTFENELSLIVKKKMTKLF